MKERKHLMALLLAAMTLPGITIALLVRATVDAEPKEQVAVKSTPTLILTPYLKQVPNNLVLTPHESLPTHRRKHVAPARGRTRRASNGNPVVSSNGGGGKCGGLSGYAWLECKESTFSPTARNGQHFGLGQLNNNARATQGKKLGIDPNTTDPNEQRQMMKGYVEDRYGSPEAAIRHHRRNGWY